MNFACKFLLFMGFQFGLEVGESGKILCHCHGSLEEIFASPFGRSGKVNPPPNHPAFDCDEKLEDFIYCDGLCFRGEVNIDEDEIGESRYAQGCANQRKPDITTTTGIPNTTTIATESSSVGARNKREIFDVYNSDIFSLMRYLANMKRREGIPFLLELYICNKEKCNKNIGVTPPTVPAGPADVCHQGTQNHWNTWQTVVLLTLTFPLHLITFYLNCGNYF